jgi:hypothetical protein
MKKVMYARRTHVGKDYAKVEVYDSSTGEAVEYEVSRLLAQAIDNMHGELRELRKKLELASK